MTFEQLKQRQTEQLELQQKTTEATKQKAAKYVFFTILFSMTLYMGVAWIHDAYFMPKPFHVLAGYDTREEYDAYKAQSAAESVTSQEELAARAAAYDAAAVASDVDTYNSGYSTIDATRSAAQYRADTYRARTMAADAELGRTIDMLDSLKDAGYGLPSSTEMIIMDMAIDQPYWSN